MEGKATDVAVDGECTQDDRRGEGRACTEKVTVKDFFFPSSAGYGGSSGCLMRMVEACGGYAMALAAGLWNVT